MRRVWLVFFVSIAGLTGCKSAAGSKLKIDNGEVIYSQSANKVEGVFYTETSGGSGSGGACTGSAVSTTTAMTAAHCLFNPGDRISSDGLVFGKRYCIDTSAYKKICSSEIYVDPAYASVARKAEAHAGNDFGYVVFPKGTFKHIFRLNPTAVAVGDRVVLVGYSEYNLPDPSKGSKRFGYNTVSEIVSEQRSAIISLYNGDFSSVAVQPGDSGGPLLKNCLLTGVAHSRGDGNDGDPNGSTHTNLTHPEILTILKSSLKAYFCGVSGDDEAFCPPASIYTSVESPAAGSRDFPCRLGIVHSEGH